MSELEWARKIAAEMQSDGEFRSPLSGTGNRGTSLDGDFKPHPPELGVPGAGGPQDGDQPYHTMEQGKSICDRLFGVV